MEPVFGAREVIWESQSTEEVLRKIKEANSRLKQEGARRVIVGSLNVEALYPSIDQKEGPRMVAEEVRKSKINFKNIDFHLATVYLGVTMDRQRQIREAVAHLLPSRKARSKRGRKVTVHMKELGGPVSRKVAGEGANPIGRNLDEEPPVDKQPEESKWFKYHREYTQEEKKLLISKVVQVALEATSSNHI